MTNTPNFREDHKKFLAEQEARLKRRRDRLAIIYTNSVEYDDLGWGLQELVNYVIKLEDAVPTTREDIRRMSYSYVH